MTPASTGGYAAFEGHQTWYRAVGELPPRKGEGEAGGGPVPLVTRHGGPGAAHDYLLPVAGLATGGRAVIFHDQAGNAKSTPLPGPRRRLLPGGSVPARTGQPHRAPRYRRRLSRAGPVPGRHAGGRHRRGRAGHRENPPPMPCWEERDACMAVVGDFLGRHDDDG